MRSQIIPKHPATTPALPTYPKAHSDFLADIIFAPKGKIHQARDL